MNPDIINGLFELVGAWVAWANAWKLHAQKEIKGVYWPAWVFYSAWGLWNLVYYPSLNQWASFAGGVLLVSGNIAWVAMAWRFGLLRPEVARAVDHRRRVVDEAPELK